MKYIWRCIDCGQEFDNEDAAARHGGMPNRVDGPVASSDIADAYRRGQEEMRELVANVMAVWTVQLADRIRALPIKEQP